MEVVVHGTKGGYRILFKTPGAPSIGSDIRNNVSSEAAIGKSAYSIAFATNGCVFTKYIIIRDALRNDATGFIAFSLLLLFNEQLQNKGADVKSILDELSNHYIDNYVRNNSINKGEANIIQEDWSFINNISGRKTEHEKNRNNIEIQAGTKEAAFIFYKDDSKLQEYFSKPYQEDYNGYKQIFLISEELRNSSADLLNVLRNSGVELNVDLKNEYFFLTNYDRRQGLTIMANGRLRSDAKTNNSIRAKDRVKIRYIKDYYKPIEEEGRLSDLSSDIYKYLETRGTQIFIKYDALSNNLKPIEKTITFNVKDWKGNPVNGAKLICENAIDVKPVTYNNQIAFKGDELGNRWTVSANTDRFFSESKTIDFEKVCQGDTGIIDIVLNKHTLKITAHEGSIDGDIIKDNVNLSKSEFIGNEIGIKHKITVSCRGFKKTYFEYEPAKDEIPKHILLERDQYSSGIETSHSYFVSAGQYGTLKDGNSYISKSKDGTDVRHAIIPNEGYKFIRFEEQVGTLVAIYEKKKPFYQTTQFIVGSIVGTTVLSFGIWALISLFVKDTPDLPQQPDVQYIKAYIEGNSLILDTLNNYKYILGEGQTEVLKSLDSAIKKREFINDLNFSELKILYYYPAQQKLKTAIHNIDSTRYNHIRNNLGNVSSWSLDQITDSIKNILNPAKPVTEKNEEIKNEEFPIEIKQPAGHKQEKEETQIEITKAKMTEQKNEEKKYSPIASTDDTKDITKKLLSGSVTRDELKDWKNAGMDRKKGSVELYLKFWSIINSGQKDDFDKLLKDLNSDAILKNSELRKFLISICASSEAFQKFNNTSGKATCKTIAELKNKVK